MENKLSYLKEKVRGAHANFIQLADRSPELPRGPRDKAQANFCPLLSKSCRWQLDTGLSV